MNMSAKNSSCAHPLDSDERRSVEYDFVLSDSERTTLLEILSSVKSNPYLEYSDFCNDVDRIASTVVLPATLTSFTRAFLAGDAVHNAFAFGRNCPIDANLPFFNWENPVEEKYLKKKTFIAEAFLTLMATLLGKPAIAHRSVNSGDFFHDIAPKRSMATSQSQKTIETLHFHKDFTNHFARPDYVIQIVLRNDPVNEVYSTYVRNIDILSALPEHVKEVLQSIEFHTPYDDISIQESGKKLGKAAQHAIIEGESEFRVFENRTRGLTQRAEAALKVLLSVMHEQKVSNVPEPGDFVIIRNNYSLHGKEVANVSNVDSLRSRWIMKTHNVDDVRAFGKFFEPNNYGVIDG